MSKRNYFPLILLLIALMIGSWIFSRFFDFSLFNDAIYPQLFIVALGVSLIQELLNPIFSQFALQSIGGKTKYWQQLWILMFSTSVNSTVPVPAGIPLRLYLQQKFLQISYAKSASGVFVETVVGYGITIVMALISCLIWLRPAVNYIEFDKEVYRWLIFGLVGFGMILSSLFYLQRAKWQKRLSQFWVQMITTTKEIKILPIFGMVLTILVSTVFSIARMQMLLLMFGVQVGSGGVLAGMLLSRVLGVISFVPMGLGVRDVSLTSLLVLLNVPTPVAITVSAIDRIVMITPFLLGGALATHQLGKNFLDAQIQSGSSANPSPFAEPSSDEL